MDCKHYWFSIREDYFKEKNVNVYDVLCSYKTIKKWACILHDRDVYSELDEFKNSEHKQGTKKPNHYHIYVNFGSQSVKHTLVANWFKIGENMVQRIDTTANNCLLYFVHGTNDAIMEGKYQYTWSDVKHSSNWSPQVLAEQVQYIGHFEKFSYKEQIEKVHSIVDTQERVKMQELLDKSLKTELQYRSTFVDRYIQVMFITGNSGSGKTTFARQLVEKMNYFDIVPKEYWRKEPNDSDKPFRHLDYGISGMSNDVFESYKGEDVYILDDMRDTSFDLPDLLKFLDNHTNSSVKVRFANKCFVGVLLIITSTVPLSKWYKDLKRSGIESLKQLYRRINSYVIVDDKEITFYEDINDNGEPFGYYTVIPNKTAEYYKDKPKSISLCNIAKNVFNANEYVSSLDNDFDKAIETKSSEQLKIEIDK